MNKGRHSASQLRNAAPSLIAIAIGLVVGILIIVLTNPSQAGEAVINFLKGPFNFGRVGVGNLFYYATPLLMCGLAVAFGYQTAMFNIGASGQYLLGAFLAVLFSIRMATAIPSSILWIPALLVALIAGLLYGALIGALKAYRNVNEVISSIMLNYTSMYLVNDLIKRLGIYDNLKNQTQDIAASIPKMGLDKLFPGTIAGGGIIIGLLCVMLLDIILKKTTFGYEIKGVGLNRYAAQYAGINENKSIILSMAISGGLAAMAGAMVVLSGAGNHIVVQDVVPAEGFDGIAVSLLGLNQPWGVFFSALFIAHLKMGGQAIQTLGYSPELITMIISFILYFSALSVLFRRILSQPAGSAEEKGDGEGKKEGIQLEGGKDHE